MDMNIQEEKIESQRRRQSQDLPALPCLSPMAYSRGSSAPAFFGDFLGYLIA